jgi:hypothetical protein
MEGRGGLFQYRQVVGGVGDVAVSDCALADVVDARASDTRLPPDADVRVWRQWVNCRHSTRKIQMLVQAGTWQRVNLLGDLLTL